MCNLFDFFPLDYKAFDNLCTDLVQTFRIVVAVLCINFLLQYRVLSIE